MTRQRPRPTNDVVCGQEKKLRESIKDHTSDRPSLTFGVFYGMVRIKYSLKIMLAAFFMLTALYSQIACAQMSGMTLIRDVEIETAIKEWVAPIFKAAGLDPEGVHIILVQDDSLNAFVAGGSNIFIYTGLIEATNNPGELIGVIAHETGHITGGHLIKSREAMERASYESMIGTVLGVGAAIATGDSSAAGALTIGGGSIAQRSYLAHSRVQESSADQAAITFMEAAHYNPTGMKTFMEKLKGQMYLPSTQQTEYVQTHPLVENRIEALERRVGQSSYKDAPYPAEWVEQHARMKAKLVGFVKPNQVSWVYEGADQSIPAQYARAISAYKNNQVNDALKRADDLIALEPKNPYFLELKGQMLMDFARADEAVTYYKRALDVMPTATLIRIAYAHALTESKAANGSQKEQILKEAIENLERSGREEPRSSRVFRLLATAYGRLGDEPMAKVNLAEEAVLQRNYLYAKEQAEGVLNTAPENSKAWLKAKDVISFIDQHDGE